MGEERVCIGCGESVAVLLFPARGARCLPCRRAFSRRHYAANRPYYIEKARRRQVRVIAEVRAWLVSYLRTHPCVDCGETDIRVLEFDHRNGEDKIAEVSWLARSGYSLARVQAEITRCDVRCANCHRLRTHKQRGWWGALIALEEVSAPGGIRTPKPSDP